MFLTTLSYLPGRGTAGISCTLWNGWRRLRQRDSSPGPRPCPGRPGAGEEMSPSLLLKMPAEPVKDDNIEIVTIIACCKHQNK